MAAFHRAAEVLLGRAVDAFSHDFAVLIMDAFLILRSDIRVVEAGKTNVLNLASRTRFPRKVTVNEPSLAFTEETVSDTTGE